MESLRTGLNASQVVAAKVESMEEGEEELLVVGVEVEVEVEIEEERLASREIVRGRRLLLLLKGEGLEDLLERERWEWVELKWKLLFVVVVVEVVRRRLEEEEGTEGRRRREDRRPQHLLLLPLPPALPFASPPPKLKAARPWLELL